MHYRQDVRQSAEHARVQLIAISIVTVRLVFGSKSEFDYLRFGKLPPHICESCVATYRHSHESFSALQSTSIPVTDVENSVQIHSLAMLSFLKMLQN